MTHNYSDFLRAIYQEHDKNIFRTYCTNKAGELTMKSIPASEIEKENEQECIYFIPNIGGTKVIQINKFRCVFADIDAGRPEKHKYYPKEIVDNFKKTALAKIQSFDLKPTAIVETRNGYHVYWALSESPETETWITIQKKLWNYFDSDDAVDSPHQPMRLPYTWWRKPGHEPYFVEIRELNEFKYFPEEFLTILKDVEALPRRPKPSQGKQSISSPNIHPDVVFDGDNRVVEAIINGNIEFLRQKIQPEHHEFDTPQQIHEYLTKEIDLRDFLEVGQGTFHCLFHEDSTPSASISVLDSGEQFYKCFGCKMRGNIKAVVQTLQGCSHAVANRFLKRIFGVEQLDTDWQREQRENLEEVKRIIGTLHETVPDLYKNIAKDLSLLWILVDKQADSLFGEHHTSLLTGEPIFYVSQRHIMKLIGANHHRTIGKQINSLALHKLIRKVHNDEIPEALLKRSQKSRKWYGKKRLPRISYYALSGFTAGELREANDIAILVQRSGLKRDGYVYEGFYRTFGEEVANGVFGHLGDDLNSPTPASEARTSEMIDITMEILDTRGWVTEKEIFELLTKKWKPSHARRQVRRSLPDILQTYDLVRERLTKQLKSALKDCDVNPSSYIILRRSRLESILEQLKDAKSRRMADRPPMRGKRGSNTQRKGDNDRGIENAD